MATKSVTKAEFIESMQQAHAPLEKMVGMIPEDKLDWAPADGLMTIGQVLHHLSGNWSIVKMMVTKEWPFSSPKEMEDAMKLDNMPSLSKAEALSALEKDIQEATSYLQDEITEEDFFARVVEAPWGFRGEIWKALVLARDHLLNHKMQLHMYLKLLQLPANTATLYGM